MWAEMLEVVPRHAEQPMLSQLREEQPPNFGGEDVRSEYDAVVRRENVRRINVRLRTPWPSPVPETLLLTAEFLTAHPEVMVKFRLSSVTDVEMDFLADTLLETWTGSDDDLERYIGRPVRMRSLLGSTRGGVPARARALARRWASGLSVVPLGVQRRRRPGPGT